MSIKRHAAGYRVVLTADARRFFNDKEVMQDRKGAALKAIEALRKNPIPRVAMDLENGFYAIKLETDVITYKFDEMNSKVTIDDIVIDIGSLGIKY